VEIYQLKVFLEVARCLSFTEAADTLNLTQPAVSAKIKSLEIALGTPLFQRLGRRIELTQAGEYLLEEGPQLVDLEARLVTEIEAIKQGKFSSLTVGCMANMACDWLPSKLYEYRRLYPDIKTSCQPFNDIEALYRAIKSGEADLGFSDLSFAAFDEISAIAVDTIHHGLAVSHKHSLAQRSWLSLKELTEQSWVLLPEGFPSRIILQKRMQELGLNLSDFAHVEIVDTPSLVRTYLLQGHYVTFVSDLDFQMERQAGLIQTIPLEEFALSMPLFLLMSKRLDRALRTADQQPFRGRQALEPIQQFISLLKRERPAAAIAPSVRPPASTTPPPKVPHFQAPNFRVRPHSTTPSETLRITIGTQNQTIQTITAGLIIQRLGLLEHFLPREGSYSGTQYQICWSNYSSGAPIVAGLENQQIDIGILGDYPLLLSALSGDPTATAANTRLISFVASSPDGTGNDIIVPQQSPLHCIDDLDGRTIAVPFGSAAHGMVMRSLHHRQLLQSVKLTSIDNFNTQRLTRASSLVDGYAYFAPFHEIARHKGQFRRLRQENLDGLPTFHGVVVRDDFAEQYPEIAIAYLKALLAAQYWYTHHAIATDLVSRWVKMDAAIVTKTLKSNASSDTHVVYHPETQLRADWLQSHIHHLSQIAGQEHLGHINLDRWMQPEFLEKAMATL
jgi:NitT/TauT family transport system substrate-binding protein